MLKLLQDIRFSSLHRWGTSSIGCAAWLLLVGCVPNMAVESHSPPAEHLQRRAAPERSSAVQPPPGVKAVKPPSQPMLDNLRPLEKMLESAAQPPTVDEPVLAQRHLSEGEYSLVLAVCPPPFRSALEPWVQRRRREGLDVLVIDSQPTGEELKTALRQADTERCGYVLLVGDSQLSPGGEPSDADRFVPTLYRAADATAAYQETLQLPGDFAYGDFDDDGMAQAAVGRLPVKTPAQLTSLIERIIAYEESTDFGRWRSRVDLVAGLGGFGAIVDGAIEMVAGGIITGSLPGSVRTRITHASPTSDFHPDDGDFTATVLDNYQDGARFWVYAGHGWINELDRVPPTPFGRPVLSTSDLPQLKRPHASSPIALMLACYTGAFDISEDCLAERMLLADQGPIAVLAGSRVTMPYGNASAAVGLIHAVYGRKSERLGDAWRDALREMATPASDNPELRSRRMMIDGIASLLGGGSTIDEERREHMQLYNWLGDPTLRLGAEGEIQLESLGDAVVGMPLPVQGHSPLAGKLVLELHRRLGSQHPLDPSASRYLAANETMICRHEQEIQAGHWSCAVPLGELAEEHLSSTMPVILKATITSDHGFASGSQTAWLRPAAKTTEIPSPLPAGTASESETR